MTNNLSVPSVKRLVERWIAGAIAAVPNCKVVGITEPRLVVEEFDRLVVRTGLSCVSATKETSLSLSSAGVLLSTLHSQAPLVFNFDRLMALTWAATAPGNVFQFGIKAITLWSFSKLQNCSSFIIKMGGIWLSTSKEKECTSLSVSIVNLNTLV